METTAPIVYRRKILTNPAAEFVERGAGTEALAQLVTSVEEVEDLEDLSEFVPELNGFVPKGVIFE